MLSDQDESERALTYVTQSSDEVQVDLNVDAPPTVHDIPTEVSYGLRLCDRRLMAFSLQGWGDVGSPDVADEIVEEPDYGPEDIEPSW